MSTELEPKSEREKRLTHALTLLTPQEQSYFRYYQRSGQAMIAEETADALYLLFIQGKTTDEIRRSNSGFSAGQIVAARVFYDWDARRDAYRHRLQTEVPDRARQVHVETVDFLADMLTATQVLTRERLAKYIATKDEKHLEGIPLPKSLKDLQATVELFMKTTGQDKKRVEFSGKVTVANGTGIAAPVSSEEAADIAAQLLAEGS